MVAIGTGGGVYNPDAREDVPTRYRIQPSSTVIECGRFPPCRLLRPSRAWKGGDSKVKPVLGKRVRSLDDAKLWAHHDGKTDRHYPNMDG
jgi:hypothetical protein